MIHDIRTLRSPGRRFPRDFQSCADYSGATESRMVGQCSLAIQVLEMLHLYSS